MSNYAKYKDIGEEKIDPVIDNKNILYQSKNKKNNYLQYKNLEDEKALQIRQSNNAGIPIDHGAYNSKNNV